MPSQSKLLLGVCAAILSALCFSFYGATVKLLGEQGASFYETVFFAFFISWLILLPYALKKGIRSLKTNAIGLHLLRAFFGLSFMYALVVALKLVPLVTGIMLNNTAPLFMPFISHYWLGVKMSKKIWFALVLGLAGVALILKPTQAVFSGGSLLALLSGILIAFSWASVRKLSIKEPVYRIIFYYFFFASLITLIPLLIVHPPLTVERLLTLIGCGTAFMLATLFITYASTLISIVTVSILYYTLIIFSGILNWLFWHQIPDVLTLIGIVLVIAGGIVSILLEKHRHKKELID